MAKEDNITVLVRAGDTIIPYKLTASQNGRKVEYQVETSDKIVWILVRETTRGGTVVWEDRFRADEVVGIRKSAKAIE